MKASKILFLVFVIMMSLWVVNTQPARSQSFGTIYISSDCTFTSNIYEPIVVTADNIIIDGAGYTLQGTGADDWDHKGIDLSFRNNVTIKNMRINNFYLGIYILLASNNSIIGNNITNNEYGIWVVVSSNNVFRNNHMNNNKYNFQVELLYRLPSDFVNDIDASNTVDGKPIYYWINERDKTVPSDAGYVALVNCTNITAQNLHLTNNGQGVTLAYTTNSTIAKNNIANNEYGFWLHSSSNNTITENNIKNIGFSGIELNGHSNNNSILGNNIEASHTAGIHLELSSDNRIVGNNITNNNVGIYFSMSYNNTIYHNNFISNTNQFSDLAWEFSYAAPSVNIWDDGYPSGGNYWSDYTGVDADGDGIGDTPYVMYENNQDNYPLMHYWGSPPPDTTPPNISIMSPENKTYNTSDIPWAFTWNESTSWMGYSLDGQANMTIAGNTTLTGLSEGSHNLTVYANDTYGNTGTSETIYFSTAQQSEPQKSAPLPTTWIATAIVITVVVGAALLVYFRKIKKTTGEAEKMAEGVK